MDCKGHNNSFKFCVWFFLLGGFNECIWLTFICKRFTITLSHLKNQAFIRLPQSIRVSARLSRVEFSQAAQEAGRKSKGAKTCGQREDMTWHFALVFVNVAVAIFAKI